MRDGTRPHRSGCRNGRACAAGAGWSWPGTPTRWPPPSRRGGPARRPCPGPTSRLLVRALPARVGRRRTGCSRRAVAVGSWPWSNPFSLDRSPTREPLGVRKRSPELLPELPDGHQQRKQPDRRGDAKVPARLVRRPPADQDARRDDGEVPDMEREDRRQDPEQTGHAVVVLEPQPGDQDDRNAGEICARAEVASPNPDRPPACSKLITPPATMYASIRRISSQTSWESSLI